MITVGNKIEDFLFIFGQGERGDPGMAGKSGLTGPLVRFVCILATTLRLLQQQVLLKTTITTTTATSTSTTSA